MTLALLVVVIRLYNTFGVPDETVHRARAEADAILASAGVQVTWRDCEAAACADAAGKTQLVVRVAAAPAAARDAMLGYSYIDLETRSGVLATIFADRVHAMARASASDAGMLLGAVLAHEIGHMLLGTNDHAGAGLMRARWSVAEIRRHRPADWAFSPDEASAMRSNLMVAGPDVAERPDLSRLWLQPSKSSPHDRMGDNDGRSAAQANH
jgi:hypothetical protein